MEILISNSAGAGGIDYSDVGSDGKRVRRGKKRPKRRAIRKRVRNRLDKMTRMYRQMVGKIKRRLDRITNKVTGKKPLSAARKKKYIDELKAIRAPYFKLKDQLNALRKSAGLKPLGKGKKRYNAEQQKAALDAAKGN